ncbi:MAG: hypothetical protein ACP5KV_00880 [Candidatus Methanomethylicaceae archaeon]
MSDAGACEMCIHYFEVYVEGKVLDRGCVDKYAQGKAEDEGEL